MLVLHRQARHVNRCGVAGRSGLLVERGTAIGELEDAAARERAGLVRLCARLSGDADAAEDLAQETLLEAWRHEHKLRDRGKRQQWLAGIARNVCLRRARRRGRDHSRLARLDAGDSPDALLADLPDGGASLEVEMELERGELATLLDRALALLPAETRAVLVQRYVEESPHAEIAARLGLSEDAVSMRLTRGKLALRRVLATELRDELSAYGLDPSSDGTWEETRLWCPMCGRRKLLGYFRREEASFALRCPDCHPPETYEANATQWPELVGGVQGYKPALSRLAAWGHGFYTAALPNRSARCPRCGAPVELLLHMPLDGPLRDVRGVHHRCGACGRRPDASLAALAFWQPEVRRFWREHPRVRTLPERELDVGGCAALLIRFETLAGTAGVDVIHARDTYELLDIHGATGE